MQSKLYLFSVFAAFAAASTTNSHHLPKRPNIIPAPYDSGKPMPCSPAREPNRVCFVQPGTAPDRDDAAHILDSFHKCNDGGTVVLDQSYLIGSPLDLTFLKHIDVVITGEIHFDTSNVYYWAENSFKYDFQNQSVYWKWGGEDVNIYGDLSREKSVIDGHGQPYWEEIQTNKSWFNIIANSSDILISNMDLRAESLNDVEIANSDGWDTYRSDRVVIQDSYIINTDDCVSFKPNSTNVVIQGLDCTGSHGMSVGSLGQYANETDIVENLYIYNVSLTNASDSARIKVWPVLWAEEPNAVFRTSGKQGNNQAGDIVSKLMNFTQANLTISDVTIKNMYGTTSGKENPEAGTLVCSAPDRCSNIRAENITVQVPSREPPVYECRNVDPNLLDISCMATDETERDTTQG
ncbi:Exopolygalacturonase [Alternaria gaisen]|uniref:Exopolygalacturonase n=1 Tax=Alternaria gaisen TaxID=167740 RepID=A0ACB6FKA7_9PLEO|nr:Exopolygalacturonase [Alternaria gaisen]